MPARADITIAQTTAAIQYNGAGSQYIVQITNGDLYLFYGDTGSDLAFKKSTDEGHSWSNPTIVFTGTITGFAVWYDRWSDIAAGLIHLAYTESGTHDTLYRTVNTASSDALSTQTVIFAGVSAVTTGSCVSITRARGGNVYCKTTIDAGAEGGFYRLPNANVPDGAWDAARTNTEALATLDNWRLVPGFAADNQDIMAIFCDASVTELSRYVYDDSANTWAETSIDATITELTPATAYPNFNVAVDLTNSQIILIAWSAVDAASQDLRCWTITESAITAKTDVVANATDDCGLCAMSIDLQTGYWYAFYAGNSDGSETWASALNIYYKGSTDSGSTWSPQTKVTSATRALAWMATIPRIYLGRPMVAYHNNATIKEIQMNISVKDPRANYLIGI
jgi:hypothetical protein